MDNKIRFITKDEYLKLKYKDPNTYYHIIDKFPAPKRVTIIFEESRNDIYNEVERITSDDFDFLGEETKDGGLKINFTIHKGEWKWTET